MQETVSTTPAASEGSTVQVAQTPAQDILVRMATRMNPNYPRLPAHVQQTILSDMRVVYGEVAGTPNPNALGTYVPREAGMAYGYADLQGLKERLLAPREIVRDEAGFLYHHELPLLDESVRVDQFLAAFSVETAFVSMESDCPDDPRVDQYFEGEQDCAWWEPTPPEGDGWQLGEIYDTEDGVYAMFMRSRPPAVKVPRRAQRTGIESLDLGYPNTNPRVMHGLQEADTALPNCEENQPEAQKSQGACLCQEDLGHPEGTCQWLDGKRPCELDSGKAVGV